ncbi:hypothetical protein KY386_03250 [Candidatus Parcubacteria bacterium]|nr:hypothetical protein [Candidatus Parcubacteria bacterium]
MDLLLHPATASQLEAVAAHPHAAYIFTGPRHIGKLSAALLLAQRLNCADGGGDGCRGCSLIAAGNHPDVTLVSPTDKASTGIAQVQALQQAVSLTRYDSLGKRVVVVESGDSLTTEAQNCLLKTIEEPPLGTVMILLTEQLTSLLVTVRSRCQVVQFRPLSADRIGTYLRSQLALEADKASHIALLAAGSVGLATSLARDSELYESYRQAELMAERIGRSSRFERLVLAQELAQSSVDVERLVSTLTRDSRRHLRRTAATGDHSSMSEAAVQLRAIERFERHRASNVSLKTALAGLLVEL